MNGAEHSADFVHVLLFECSACGTTIEVQRLSGFRNLESVDADSFRITCHCGWSGDLLGAEARRHLVEARTQDSEENKNGDSPKSVSQSPTSERRRAS